MFIDRRIFFNCRRLFYFLIVSLFVCIGIYNYRYVERHRKYEYESTVIEEELKLILLNLTNELSTLGSLNERFKERHELMLQKCEEYQLNGYNGTKRQPNSWEFLINDKYKLIWCNVFKAASTSWFYNFNLLAGYKKEFLDKTKETPVSVARKKYPRPSAEELYDALKDHLSFIIVRHPFERLISAYRDKFSYPYDKYFRPLGEKMIKATRDNMYPDKLNSYPPTFKEFINYILCQWEIGTKINEHWIPVNNLCTPCQVNFDLILKVETLNEDQNYLINQAKIQNIVKPTWKNPSRNETTNILKDKYFSQLEPDQVSLLMNMFKLDLELFGYSAKDYEKYSTGSEFLLSKLKCKRKNEFID